MEQPPGDDDLPQLPKRTVRSVLGLTGTILLTLMACNVAFVATCGTVGFIGVMSTQNGGSGVLTFAIILGALAAAIVGNLLCVRFFGIGFGQSPDKRK